MEANVGMISFVETCPLRGVIIVCGGGRRGAYELAKRVFIFLR